MIKINWDSVINAHWVLFFLIWERRELESNQTNHYYRNVTASWRHSRRKARRHSTLPFARWWCLVGAKKTQNGEESWFCDWWFVLYDAFEHFNIIVLHIILKAENSMAWALYPVTSWMSAPRLMACQGEETKVSQGTEGLKKLTWSRWHCCRPVPP